jgi:hypothetical protein
MYRWPSLVQLCVLFWAPVQNFRVLICIVPGSIVMTVLRPGKRLSFDMMSSGDELYVRCMSIAEVMCSSARSNLVWASHTQYSYECSGTCLAGLSAIQCAFGNAGWLSTSLSSSCVGSVCVMRRIQCVSRLSPIAALNAFFTTSVLVLVLRILFLKSVGCSVLGPRGGPTLSGPCPVGVTRPCLSVSVVFHPCLSVNVCVCCCCKRDCNQAASEVPRLWRVDDVLRMAWLARYSSFGNAFCGWLMLNIYQLAWEDGSGTRVSVRHILFRFSIEPSTWGGHRM